MRHASRRIDDTQDMMRFCHYDRFLWDPDGIHVNCVISHGIKASPFAAPFFRARGRYPDRKQLTLSRHFKLAFSYGKKLANVFHMSAIITVPTHIYYEDASCHVNYPSNATSYVGQSAHINSGRIMRG